MKGHIYKQGILSLLALAFILAYFNIPFYSNWLKYKVQYKYKELFELSEDLSKDNLMAYRFGDDYYINKYIEEHFDSLNFDKPILFLPPKKYFDRLSNKYDWHESLQFYYFTGVKPVHINSKEYNKATHALLANETNYKIIEIENDQVLNLVVEEFNQYK